LLSSLDSIPNQRVPARKTFIGPTPKVVKPRGSDDGQKVSIDKHMYMC
jgi:hypothetical protein